MTEYERGYRAGVEAARKEIGFSCNDPSCGEAMCVSEREKLVTLAPPSPEPATHAKDCYYLRSSDMDGDEAARCDCQVMWPPAPAPGPFPEPATHTHSDGFPCPGRPYCGAAPAPGPSPEPATRTEPGPWRGKCVCGHPEGCHSFSVGGRGECLESVDDNGDVFCACQGFVAAPAPAPGPERCGHPDTRRVRVGSGDSGYTLCGACGATADTHGQGWRGGES